MNDISKDKNYQEFFAGIKELAKGLMQIRERAAIEDAPIVEEFCARKHATANEVAGCLTICLSLPMTNAYCLCTRKFAEDSSMIISKP